jgi:hypothetical protein
MIAALAGRRIDQKDATPPRFPPTQVDRVSRELRRLFQDHGVSVLVSSAACGADLVALDVAGSLKIRFRIVLPFDAAHFKMSSVVDRGGEWSELFERFIGAAEAAGDLIVLGFPQSDNAYERATQAILDEAGRLARGGPVLAVAVWELESRGPGDHTEQFLKGARDRGYSTAQINSSGSGGSDPKTSNHRSA